MILSNELFSVIVTDFEKLKALKCLYHTNPNTFYSLSGRNELKTKGNKIRLIMIDKGTSKIDSLLT